MREDQGRFQKTGEETGGKKQLEGKASVERGNHEKEKGRA